MHYLYCITNKVNGKVYAGITNDLKHRWSSHVYASKHRQTPLYSAIRKYGLDSFKMELVNFFGTKEECCEVEKYVISFLQENNIPNYNLSSGGEGGFIVPTDKIDQWKEKLRTARKGRTPAVGLKHSEEVKEVCSIASKKRWEISGTYPPDVVNYSFAKAREIYGISKTHYYRLKEKLCR